MTWPPGPALLFCPADRPERFAKAAAAADVVILDLEDGVAPDARPFARGALREEPLDPARTIVRVNPHGTPDHDLDLAALDAAGYDTVMLAKAERSAQVASLAPRRVVVLCETARGVLAAETMAEEAATLALMWGAEDLMVSLGGRSSRSPDGEYREVARSARSRVLLAAAAAGVPALDAIHLDIADTDGLRAEAEDAVASGFAGTVCIHPSQARVVREAYAPTEAELRWAQRVVAAARDEPLGVFALDGRMVDSPVIRQAERVVAWGSRV